MRINLHAPKNDPVPIASALRATTHRGTWKLVIPPEINSPRSHHPHRLLAVIASVDQGKSKHSQYLSPAEQVIRPWRGIPGEPHRRAHDQVTGKETEGRGSKQGGQGEDQPLSSHDSQAPREKAGSEKSSNEGVRRTGRNPESRREQIPQEGGTHPGNQSREGDCIVDQQVGSNGCRHGGPEEKGSQEPGQGAQPQRQTRGKSPRGDDGCDHARAIHITVQPPEEEGQDENDDQQNRHRRWVSPRGSIRTRSPQQGIGSLQKPAAAGVGLPPRLGDGPASMPRGAG